MKKALYSVFMIFYLFVLIITGCSQTSSSDDISKIYESGFAIYRVKSGSIQNALSYGRGENEKYIDGKKVDLTSIKIETEPLLTDKDIKKYHWKTHVIELNTEFLKIRNLSQKDIELIDDFQKSSGKNYGGSKLLNTLEGEAVVITVEGNKIYSAGFTLPMISSACSPEITIDDFGLDSISIKNIRRTDDLRKDNRIYDFFKKQGKLVE